MNNTRVENTTFFSERIKNEKKYLKFEVNNEMH